MKYNLIFYGIGFLILIVSNSYVNNLEKDSNYKYLSTQRCLEIQTALNEDLKQCL